MPKIIFILFMITFFLFGCSVEKNRQINHIEKNIKNVKLGMSKLEIKSLLGEPQQILNSSVSGKNEEMWIYPHKDTASEFPTCIFDSSTGRVTEVIYGDETRLKIRNFSNKRAGKMRRYVFVLLEKNEENDL